jgi:chitin synthase
VVAWMVANAVVAMAVSEAYNNTDVADNFYLKFILWSVAAVALFRALGSSAFGVIAIVHAFAEGKLRLDAKRLAGMVPDWVSEGYESAVSGSKSLWSGVLGGSLSRG